MRKFSLLLTSLASLAACGGDDDGVTVIDGGAIDSAGGGADGPAACTISTAAFGDKGALTGAATFAADTMNPATYHIGVQAALEAAEPLDILFIDFYTGYTPFGTMAAPTPVIAGTYPLTGEQLDFETCGTCVTLGTNATADGYEDDYMVTGGTMTVTAVGDAVGETLTLSLANLQLTHVTIDPQSGATTAVGDGCNTTITAATFTGTVAAPAKRTFGPLLPSQRAARSRSFH